MTGNDALDERGTRARQAEYEDRFLAGVSAYGRGAIAERTLHGGEQCLIALERVVDQKLAAGGFALDEVRERPTVVLQVFAFLREGQMHVDLRERILARRGERLFEASDVIVLWRLAPQLRQGEVRLPEPWIRVQAGFEFCFGAGGVALVDQRRRQVEAVARLVGLQRGRRWNTSRALA